MDKSENAQDCGDYDSDTDNFQPAQAHHYDYSDCETGCNTGDSPAFNESIDSRLSHTHIDDGQCRYTTTLTTVDPTPQWAVPRVPGSNSKELRTTQAHQAMRHYLGALPSAQPCNRVLHAALLQMRGKGSVAPTPICTQSYHRRTADYWPDPKRPRIYCQLVDLDKKNLNTELSLVSNY